MRARESVLAATMFAASGIALAGHADESDWTPEQVNEAWRSYTTNVEDALGIFRNIHLYEKTPSRWERISGKYLPITVKDEVPEEYHPHMRSDRPMMLPTTFEGWEEDEGQSIPYGVVGRIPGSNPEVQWVFLARHYLVKDPVTYLNSFASLRDVAVIGHHPRTGATAFFQFYDPPDPKPAATIISPWSSGGQDFWNDVTWMSGVDCAQCHSADPFIHTPWINQAKIDKRPGQAFPESVVPSNPLGPFHYIPADVGDRNILEDWDKHLVQLDAPKNVCTTCHRISRSDPLELYKNSTHGGGDKNYGFDCEKETGNIGYCFQTDKYRALPWMPPIGLAGGDFYAGQNDDMEWYADVYGAAAQEVIAYADTKDAPESSVPEKPIPSPDKDQRAIMIDRDHSDELAAGQSLLVVDTRMQANTDGSLDAWRFMASGDAEETMEARPVILRRALSGTGEMRFQVVFIGNGRVAESANTWVPVLPGADVALNQGDYLGLLLSNKGVDQGSGLVPYSKNDWAPPIGADTMFGHPEDILTYSLKLGALPQEQDMITVGEPSYRTYSFEFRNRL